MELKEILAISGQPGLYKYVAQSSRGVIVESLSDGKRMNAASNSKVSALTEISIFTEGRDSRPSATRRLRKNSKHISQKYCPNTTATGSTYRT